MLLKFGNIINKTESLYEVFDAIDVIGILLKILFITDNIKFYCLFDV